MGFLIENHVRGFNTMQILSNEKGAASIEYAILGSLIAAVIVFTVATLGTQVRTLFETVMQGW